MMEEDRLIRALQRLVTAVARLEEAQAALPPPCTADPAETERLRARIDQLAAHNTALDEQQNVLAARHARLRASAADAAARLGALIG